MHTAACWGPRAGIRWGVRKRVQNPLSFLFFSFYRKTLCFCHSMHELSRLQKSEMGQAQVSRRWERICIPIVEHIKRLFFLPPLEGTVRFGDYLNKTVPFPSNSSWGRLWGWPREPWKERAKQPCVPRGPHWTWWLKAVQAISIFEAASVFKKEEML